MREDGKAGEEAGSTPVYILSASWNTIFMISAFFSFLHEPIHTALSPAFYFLGGHAITRTVEHVPDACVR